MTDREQGRLAAAARETGHRTLAADQCWDQLRRQGEGRLGYLSGRGPRHVVLPYAVWGRALVVRVPGYHEATGYVTDAPVTFDVVERVGRTTAQRVEVVAHARLSEPKGSVLAVLPDEHWPADLPSRLVWLEVDELRGESSPVPGDPGR